MAPIVTADELSKIFDKKIMIKSMTEAGPDERIYFCNDNEIVWARDYMSQNYAKEEPLEVKARFGLDAKPKNFKIYNDICYLLCEVKGGGQNHLSTGSDGRS